MIRKTVLLFFSLGVAAVAKGQQVDYSVVNVPEERGLELMCMTQPNDYVAMPQVSRRRGELAWLANRIINVSPDGKNLAFVSVRDGNANIFVKEVGKVQGAAQRTNRSKIIDFNYSPDGKKICFSEDRGNGYQVFVTDATQGFVCQQITSGGEDYTPVYAPDMSAIFFARSERQGMSIWSYQLSNSMLSSYTTGFNPNPIKLSKGSLGILCTRMNGDGNGEIWLFNATEGTEQCLISDLNHSFTTPSVSPNGQWVVCVGSSDIPLEKGKVYKNTDIYLVKIDGSNLRQLTYHAADDISPVWSPDGKYVYFISQRGNPEGHANIWRMPVEIE